MFIFLQELEAAINYWRNLSPSQGDCLELCQEASALAKPYAMMIIQGSVRLPVDGLSDKAKDAYLKYLNAKDAS